MENPTHAELQADYSRNVANTLMLLAARRSSEVVDSYLSWLLAGSGAFIALVISNLDKLSSFVAPGAVRVAAVVMLAAAALGVVQKYLASVVQGTTEGAKEAVELAKEAIDDEIPLDLELLYREFEAASYPLTRWIMRRFGLGFRPSSPTTVGHRVSRQAQCQSFLAMGATLLVFAAVVVVVFGLDG